MKPMINLTQTVINNWRMGELKNIKRCENFNPNPRGYFWYECPTCGLKARFVVPTNLEQPTEQIGNEIIQGKKVPKKIFCPHCMLNYSSDRRYGDSNLAVNDISNNVSFMEQVPGLIKEFPEEFDISKESFFLAVFNEKVGVPIYRSFKEMLEDG